MNKYFCSFLLVLFILTGIRLANFIFAFTPPLVVINEIAWMGTESSSNKEWLELYNPNNFSVNLGGWRLSAIDGSPEIKFDGIIPSNDFYLLERTNDETLPNIPSNQIYRGALNNQGEKLELYDNFGEIIDSVDCSSGWFNGDNSTKQTMERISPKFPGSNPVGWQTSQSAGGTPKTKNSIGVKAEDEPVKTETKREVAVISEQVPKKPSFLPSLIALAVAIFSGITILILKREIKRYN